MKTLKEVQSGSKKEEKTKELKGSKSSQIEFNPPIQVSQRGMHEDAESVLDEAIDINDLMYMFEGDLSDLDEYEDLVEDLSAAQRNRRRMTMRRNKSRIKVARRRAMSRRANSQRVMQRARRMAVNRMKTKFANGRSPSKLSVAEKNRVERMVKRRRSTVTRSARRNIRTIRGLERKRLYNGFEIEINDLNILYEAFFQMKDLVDEIQ